MIDLEEKKEKEVRQPWRIEKCPSFPWKYTRSLIQPWNSGVDDTLDVFSSLDKYTRVYLFPPVNTSEQNPTSAS